MPSRERKKKRYCSFCVVGLEEDVRACPNCGEFCVYCCPKCGTEFDEEGNEL